MTLDKLEELINIEVAAGKLPTKCVLHPNTLALILEDFRNRNIAQAAQNSLREMVSLADEPGKTTGVVQLTDDRSMVQNALYFVEDDTMPEGEINLHE